MVVMTFNEDDEEEDEKIGSVCPLTRVMTLPSVSRVVSHPSSTQMMRKMMMMMKRMAKMMMIKLQEGVHDDEVVDCQSK